jgi:hypothetical protein
MKTFDFQVSFLMSCVTKGYTIRANDTADAQRKIAECIDKDGQFDFQKFEEAGGRTGGWDIRNGTDHGYELTDPDSIKQTYD